MMTDKTNEEVFYHYTSLKGLYEIVISRSLWLTSLNATNDK